MAAIPPSFVYSSGKKSNCRLIWVANAYTHFLRIAQTFYYPFSPIPMGFVPCDARVLAGLPDSTLDSSRSRRTTIFLMKAGSLERTAFVHSSMQRRNKTLWVLWNCLDTWKLFYYFFYRKDKAKLCFLQQDFLIYKNWKAWTWAKWTVVSAFMFFSLWTGAILISKL